MPSMMYKLKPEKPLCFQPSLSRNKQKQPALNFCKCTEIMVHCTANIIVGLPLDVGAGAELLSWAVRAAHRNNNITALHVLVGKYDTKNVSVEKKKMRQAKALAIAMIEEFSQPCRLKQVNLEVEVRRSSSVGKCLIEEARLLKASILVVGGSRDRPERTFLNIANYYFRHAPRGCSVIAIRTKTQQPDKLHTPREGFHGKTMKGSNKADHVDIAKPLLSKHYASETMRKSFNRNVSGKTFHPSFQTTDKKPSQVAIYDKNGRKMCILDGSFPIDDFNDAECNSPKLYEDKVHRRSNSWMNLPVVKLFFPFLRLLPSNTSKENDKHLTNGECAHPSWRCFSYDEISHATNNFHPGNMVGKGGYSEVYRGDLEDGQKIAVKRLSKDRTNENKEREFLSELGIIGHVCHPNTSYLIGCCIENGFHLIFNLAPNGNLSSALHAPKNGIRLDWAIRYKIVIGVARGLHYLHKCCKRRIIHRDIKASNVLLGPNFEPLISDFGLAKWLPAQWTHHSVIPIEGTFGYMAPEYFMHGIVDEKTDVYSFGVLLLEIITGRRPIDMSKENLLIWAKPLIESGKINELADPKLQGKYDKDQMCRLAAIASYCTRRSSIWRPSMNEVLQLLTNERNFELAQRWRESAYKDDEVDEYDVAIDC